MKYGVTHSSKVYDTLRVKICGQRYAVAKVASGYNPGSHLDRSWFESGITQYELKYGFLPVGTTVLKDWERDAFRQHCF